MWNKRTRFAICAFVFGDLFWEDIGDTSGRIENDKEFIEEVIPGEAEVLIDYNSYQNAVNAFHSQGVDAFREQWSDYIQDWKKTFLPVQSVLFTYSLEIQLTKTSHSELIGKYIKLTQDIIAGGNTGLVHAILSKFVGNDAETNTAYTEG